MSKLKIANHRGKYRDPSARSDVIRYILRPDKAVHRYCGGIHVSPHSPADSMDQTALSFGKNNGVQLHHWILSFSPFECDIPQAANEVAKHLAAVIGQEYQVVYSVHEDRRHCHIHFVFNAVSWVDGHRYRGTRSEFFRFYNAFKAVLASYGIYRLDYVPVSSAEEMD